MIDKNRNPLSFYYGKVNNDDDLTRNIDRWLENKEYNKILESNELRSYIENICTTFSKNNPVDKEETISTLLMIIWQSIERFEKIEGTKSTVARFKTWIKFLLLQVHNYNGKWYKHFINLDDCASCNYYQLDESPFDVFAKTEKDFSLNMIIDERLDELGLSNKEELILKKYFYESDTQEEISSDIKINQSTVSRILKKIQKKCIKKS